MKLQFKIVVIAGLVCALSLASAAQNFCPPRPTYGGEVVNPPALSSQNGVLTLDLSMKSSFGPTQQVRYCYVYMLNNQPVEAPTLRLNAGDQLVINFTNNITVTQPKHPLKSRHAPMEPMPMGDPVAAKEKHDPCLGGVIDATTTNIHFHGLNIPPLCHQDEVLNTIIPNGGTQFQYSTQIPPNDQFGAYWYHPHPHGFSAPQVFGGAAGALIINGSNQYTQGLPERVLVIRNYADALTDEDGQFTVNFVPAAKYKILPVINTTAGQKEFWRVLNASTNGFLTLQLYTDHALPLLLVSNDSIPLSQPQTMTTITIPPAGRAEFVIPPLTANVTTTLLTAGFDAGSIGDPMPSIRLANVVVSGGNAAKKEQLPKVPPPKPAKVAERFSGVAGKTPSTTRNLYFSETNVGSNGPGQFYITVQGQVPKLFDAMNPPAIKTKIGAIEDWTITNQTAEPHAFHIHQLHFLVEAIDGQPVPNPYLADTITVDEWPGSGPYHSVTLRMDFSDPNIAGKFVYHCHILDHEDGGMMAEIEVDPN